MTSLIRTLNCAACAPALKVLDGLAATRKICALVAQGERPYAPVVVRVAVLWRALRRF